MSIYSLIYKSSAKPNFDSEAVFKMLLTAKRYNREHEISGCILFHNQTFLQLLEGEKEQVTELYKRICEDDRHFEVQTLIDKDGTERLWEDWSMAFYDLSGNDKDITQKRNLLEIYFKTASISKQSKEIFDMFKKSALQLLH